MKNIEIDEELYQYIAKNTEYIGESASAILRRLLKFGATSEVVVSAEIAGNDVAKVMTNNLPDEQEEKLEEKAPTVVTSPEVAPKIEGSDSVFNFINKEELSMQRGAVGRFLLILAALYRAHPNHFSIVTEISGRDRLYFASSENELAESGSSTKPRQIPDSPFWVITNSNTTRKKMMLTKASISLGYSEQDVEKIRELL